jgi:PAS domain S-box-containing protein
MAEPVIFSFVVFAFSTFIALSVAFLAWQRHGLPGAMSMTLLMLAVAWWSCTAALEVLAADLSLKIFWSQLSYLGIATVPVLWFIFALEYADAQRWLTHRNLLLLFIIPGFTVLAAATNNTYAWLWARVTLETGHFADYEPGPWFWINIGYSYLLVLGGAALALRTALRLPRAYRRQIAILLVGILLPLVANLVYVLRLGPIAYLDITPLAFAISGLLLGWSILGLQLLDLGPRARSLLFDNVRDGVLVLDLQDKIVDINPAALQLLRLSTPPIGLPLTTVLSAWQEQIAPFADVTDTDFDVALLLPDHLIHHLEVRVSPLTNQRGQLIGHIVLARDATKRFEAEQRMRQLQRAVEQSPVSVVITDTTGRIEYVNPHFTQLTGYTLDEALDQNPRILKTGHTPPEVYAELWRTIAAGHEWHGEFLNRKKNGEVYWEDAHIGPVTDADGRVTHYVAVKEEITSRKRTEEELQQSRARLKAIFDNAAVGITLTNRNGRYIQVNRRWSEMSGYPIEALYQFGPIEITHPDDRAANQDKLRPLIDGALDAYELEKRYVRRDGSVFWGVLSVTAIRNTAGEFEASLGIVTDITERKAAEANLQQLTAELRGVIDATRDGILMITLDAHLSVINSVALRLLNLAGRPADWRGRSAVELLYALRRAAPEAARAGLVALRRARQTDDQQPYQSEVDVLGRTLLWQTLPVRAGDQLIGWLLTLRDLTEVRVLEQMREDMRHTMVHDLRNPLTSIATSLDVLVDEPEILQPHQLQLLQIAQRNSRRMINLVNDILDVSRLESGQMPLNLQTWPLPDLIHDALQVQQVLAQDKHITLENRVSLDLPWVYADEGLMRRVLQNLVGNAVKFTPPGGCVTLSAELTTMISAQPIVLISVQDTGPGIPPEIQSQLFQKFVTGSQKGRGSGLGLAFCKLAVEAHAQQIWVDSSPGKGTTFTFSLAAVPMGAN